MEQSLHGEVMKTQDLPDVVVAVSRNLRGYKLGWDFLRANWHTLIKKSVNSSYLYISLSFLRYTMRDLYVKIHTSHQSCIWNNRPIESTALTTSHSTRSCLVYKKCCLLCNGTKNGGIWFPCQVREVPCLDPKWATFYITCGKRKPN